MSIAERLVAARRREEQAAVEQKLVETRLQREENAREAKRQGPEGRDAVLFGASPTPAAAPSGQRLDHDVVMAVRATVLQSGRTPWWEKPDAAVETHASLVGKAQRQAALLHGDHPELSAAARSLSQRVPQLSRSVSLGPSVATGSNSDRAYDGLSSSARSAANRLNSGLPARAFPVGTTASRHAKPTGCVAAADVAQMLEAQQRRRRERTEVALRLPGARR
jgi:hypothetical protein